VGAAAVACGLPGLAGRRHQPFLYVQKGLSLKLAREVAKELSAGDPLAAHADAELGIDILWPRSDRLCVRQVG
jgi:hypothetical protein